jgi:hypothetical protein
VQGVDEVVVLAGPARRNLEGIAESAPGKGVGVEVGLGAQSFDRGRVEDVAAEDLGCVVVGSVLEGVVGFEAGCEGGEIFGELCMENNIRRQASKTYLQVR